MIKQHVVEALIGVALILTLLAGVALNGGVSMVHTVPAQHVLACGGVPSTPPCD